MKVGFGQSWAGQGKVTMGGGVGGATLTENKRNNRYNILHFGGSDMVSVNYIFLHRELKYQNMQVEMMQSEQGIS